MSKRKINVILLEKVRNLGELGAQVAVNGGFARNYLIPNKVAVPATKENIADFEARRAELEKAAQEKLAAAQARAASLTDVEVTIPANAGAEGKLFGSIGTQNIAEAITALGQEVSKSEVRMPLGPIRTTGEFEVSVQLHSDVSVEVKITVVPSAAS